MASLSGIGGTTHCIDAMKLDPQTPLRTSSAALEDLLFLWHASSAQRTFPRLGQFDWVIFWHCARATTWSRKHVVCTQRTTWSVFCCCVCVKPGLALGNHVVCDAGACACKPRGLCPANHVICTHKRVPAFSAQSRLTTSQFIAVGVSKRDPHSNMRHALRSSGLVGTTEARLPLPAPPAPEFTVGCGPCPCNSAHGPDPVAPSLVAFSPSS